MTEQTKEIQVIEQKANDVVAQATALVVTDQKQYDGCAEFLRSIKAIKHEIDLTFDDPIKKARAAHMAMVASKKKHYEPLDNAEKIVKQKSLGWWQGEQDKLEKERKSREEEARKEEEKKRKIKEDQEREWRRKEKEKQDEADRLEKEGKAEEARIAREAAEKAGEKAEERAEEAENVFVPVPDVEETATKAKGQSISVTWKAEVVDLFALCNTIARGDLPETVVQPVMKELNNLARTWKDKKKFDGVKFTAVQNMSVRA